MKVAMAQRFLIFGLVLLFAVHPALADVGSGKQTEQVKAVLHLSSGGDNGREGATVRVFKNGPIAAVEALKDGKTARLDVVGRELRFADGFTLEPETLVNNEATLIARMTVKTPTGAEHIAVVELNKRTGQSNVNGLDRVRAALAESEHYVVFASVLPELTRYLKANNTDQSDGLSMSSEAAEQDDAGWLDCAIQIAFYIGATLAMIAACGAPVVDALICLPAVLVWAAQGLAVANSCGR